VPALCGTDVFGCYRAQPVHRLRRAAEIVKEAAASGRSLREVARERGVADDVLDQALDYRAMANPPAK
jgi:aspartate ammonia-lyase